MALEGKTVIVTRPKHQAEEFSLLLRQRGAEVIFFPTIEIVPPERWKDVDEAIEQHRQYDAFVLTSSNAVRYFFERARERGMGPDALLRKTIYALGSKTAEALSFYGARAVKFPGVTNARELAMALVAAGVNHRRYLVPKGRLAGSVIAETLRAQGAVVDEVIVYDTVMPDDTPPVRAKAMPGNEGRSDAVGSIKAMIDSGEADVVTFFSPSSVENFFFLLAGSTLRDETAVAAIGETTAGALRGMDMHVDIVPERPNVEAFAAAIEHYFKSR